MGIIASWTRFFCRSRNCGKVSKILLLTNCLLIVYLLDFIPDLQYLEPALHKLSSIRATTLNGVLFDKYDLTNRDRHLLSHAKIKNMVIDSFVAVSGLVNDHKLEPEMQNTLLVS